MQDQNDPNETTDSPSKFYKATYLPSGEIDVESNGMTVFDMWALSRYLELSADKIYISVLAASEMKKNVEAQLGPVAARSMPLDIPDLRNRQQRRRSGN